MRINDGGDEDDPMAMTMKKRLDLEDDAATVAADTALSSARICRMAAL